jgi:hypothetical protein
MRCEGFGTAAVVAKSRTDPELLLAVSAIASSDAGFPDVVEQMEHLLVEAQACRGLVVLDQRGEAIFPIAGNGGRVPRSLSDAILSRPVRAGARNVRVLFVSEREDSNRCARLADFVAEQIGALLARDHPLDRRDALRDRLTQLQQELTAGKLIARAKGLLMSKHHLSELAADRWIEQESRRAGVSAITVAQQIIAAHTNHPEQVTPNATKKTA